MNKLYLLIRILKNNVSHIVSKKLSLLNVVFDYKPKVSKHWNEWFLNKDRWELAEMSDFDERKDNKCNNEVNSI